MSFIVRGETSDRGVLRVSLRGQGTQQEFREFVEGYLRDNAAQGARLQFNASVDDVLQLKDGQYIAIVETPILAWFNTKH